MSPSVCKDKSETRFRLGSVRESLNRPEGYLPGPDLEDAIQVALLLRKPLLLTGRPGTGKTELGRYLASAMNLPHEKFVAKSNSIARDLFYTYDAIGHFRSAGGDVKPFLTFNGLGRAFLNCAKPTDDLMAVLPERIPGEPKQSVVVIDEIDKAPRDFPNDLLNEIDLKYFHIPELRNVKVEALEDKAPILVITSNSEKNLPDAFLRRCVYYDIPFPGERELKRIVSRRLVELADAEAPLLQAAVGKFLLLAGDSSPMQHKPGTAELLDWIAALLESGAKADVEPDMELIRKTYTAMVKRRDDDDAARQSLGLPARAAS